MSRSLMPCRRSQWPTSAILAMWSMETSLWNGGGTATSRGRLGQVRFFQLPPVRAADETLRDVCRLDGSPIDDEFRTGRTNQLLALFRAETPDILITEQFPFGRTRLRFELLPLLEVARAQRPRPVIVSSESPSPDLYLAETRTSRKSSWLTSRRRRSAMTAPIRAATRRRA